MARKKRPNITNIVPTSITPATSVQRYMQEVERRRLAVLQQISQLPIAVLIWGPAVSAGSPVSTARQLLRDELLQKNHLARFSEDLYDPNLPFSLIAQQVSHVQSHDIVF